MDHISVVIIFTLHVAVISWFALRFVQRNGSSNTTNEPFRLPDFIPYVTNTYQNLANMGYFLERAIPILREKRVVMFDLGLKKIYWIAGPELVQAVFAPNLSLSANLVPLLLQDKLWGMPKNERTRFANDHTGRSSIPNPGSMDSADQRRFWYEEHQIYNKFLTHPTYSNLLAQRFFQILSSRLDVYSKTTWTEIRLFDFMQEVVAECAVITLFGSRILEQSPDLIRAIWELDNVLSRLVWGLPRFILPGPYRVRDRVHRMAERYLESAWKSFDWNGSDADCEWDVHFGARVSREAAKWLRNSEFTMQTAAGHTTARFLGLTSNTMPTATWALFELIQRPQLLEVARAEADSAFIPDVITGQRTLDRAKLLSMPTLQAIYVECLRLRTSFNVTREVVETVTIGGYRLKKGSLIQAPTAFAHFDENAWATDKYPASEFWPQRHIQYQQATDEAGNPTTEARFVMKGRPSSFYPYGGGEVVCPGRHFARQQIIMVLAIIIVKFDMDIEEWIYPDGKKSSRAAQSDKLASGMVVMRPDRDLKVRWRRRW